MLAPNGCGADLVQSNLGPGEKDIVQHGNTTAKNKQDILQRQQEVCTLKEEDMRPLFTSIAALRSELSKASHLVTDAIGKAMQCLKLKQPARAMGCALAALFSWPRLCE